MKEEERREIFEKVAKEIEDKFQMSGLSGGLYEDYAYDCTKEYIKKMDKLGLITIN